MKSTAPRASAKINLPAWLALAAAIAALGVELHSEAVLDQRIQQVTELREARYAQMLSTNLNRMRAYQRLPAVGLTNYANAISVYMDTMQDFMLHPVLDPADKNSLAGAVYLSGGNVRPPPQTNSPAGKP